MIIVTGAAGFIGSIIVDALNKTGETDVLAVDTLGADGKFKNLRAKSLTDIIDPDALLAGLDDGSIKPDAVIHMGAITDTSEKDADRLLAMNTKYTRRLAKHCIDSGIRFIYASSASVYGDGTLGFADDELITPTLLPLNPYAYSKWLFDTEAIRNGWTSKIAGFRFFNVFGPNEYHKGFMASVIWHSYKQVMETGKIRLFQSHKEGIAHGEQMRDFVYVMDIADVILWSLKNPSACGIFNLGSGKARSYNDLAKSIFAALGREPQIEYVPTPESIRASYQYFTEADLGKLRSAGCTTAFRPLEATVADYVRTYLATGNPYA